MANVDPIRRAEIGREKRARTRAQLVAAARSLFRKQPVELVTVDDVVKEAGVAKGTFYVHFDHLQALTTAVADELVKSIDDLLQPVRLSVKEPAHRIAFGCWHAQSAATGGACEQHVSGIDISKVRQLGDRFRRLEHEVGGVVALARRTVDRELEFESVDLRKFAPVQHREKGADRTEAAVAFPLEELRLRQLHIPRAEIVAIAIAKT